MSTARALARLAGWGSAAFALVLSLVAWLALRATEDLERGRERLLAGDFGAARAAFDGASRWPRARPAARAGRLVAAASEGRPVAERVPLERLEALGFEALLLSALQEGRLPAAASIADLARRCGHPLGSLYAAVFALEQGDDARARAIAAGSTAALGSRGLGVRLRRALAARETGAGALLVDREGELVATVRRDGTVELEADAAPLLAGVRERLPALPRGEAVRLSVDVNLSRAAADALAGSRGSIVLVEPKTGAVLAAVSDARTVASEGAAAFAQRREPASIAKILTAAAVYRAGVDADAAIARMTCTGVERYGGQPLWCAWPAGPLRGLDHALAVSCNVAFASLGARVGAGPLVEEHRRWGFDAPADALLGAAGRLRALPRTPRQAADLAVGLELADVTPVHAALLAATVANGGRLVEPRLVAGPCGPLGLTRDALPPGPGRQVLDPAVARRLMQAMSATAERGTGAGLAPPGFPVVMKTGTGAGRGLGYHVNYVGAAPLEDPRIAFCVRVTHAKSSPAVTREARDVTRRLLAALADRRHRPWPHGQDAW